MSFPASVTTLRQAKNKGGRNKTSSAAPDKTGAGKSNANHGRKDIGGVILEFGSEGAARAEKDAMGKWTWEFASERKDDLKLEIGEPQMLFPPSRALPLVRTTPPKPIEAQYLEYIQRIYDKYEYLGLDTVLAEEMNSEFPPDSPILPKIGKGGEGGFVGQKVDLGGKKYDPFAGKKMVWIRNGYAKNARNLVLFATGELENHLCVAVLLGEHRKKFDKSSLTRCFVGSTTLARYPTPILQIVSSSLNSPHREDSHATFLIIRQHSSITAYRVIPCQTYKPPSTGSYLVSDFPNPIKLDILGEIRTTDLHGERPMDVTLDPSEWGKVGIIDECGGVWIWKWDRKATAHHDLNKMNLESITKERNTFFRISFGTRPGTILVMSYSEVIIIDIEESIFPTKTVLKLDSPRKLVALDATACIRQATYTCLVSTHEILWIDETRDLSPPILSWKHELSEGQLLDLVVTHVPQQNNDCYIVSSRSSHLLMVFHVSTHGALQSLHPPYTLALDLDPRLKPLDDLTIIDGNIDRIDENGMASDPDLALMAIAFDGSVWSAPLCITNGEGESGHFKIGWDEVLQSRAEEDLAEEKKLVYREKEDKAKRRVLRSMPLGWTWSFINKEIIPQGDEPIFCAEEFERYVRGIDAPFNGYVTAAELARDSILIEGEEIKRSQILRPLPTVILDPTELNDLSSLNLQRDLHLVKQHSIPSHIIDGHLPDTSPDLTNLISIRQTLSTAFPNRAPTATTQSRHRRAIDTLAIDLALSSSVLSSEPLPTIGTQDEGIGMTDDDVLARAAGLSITEREAPEVVFSVLHSRGGENPEKDESRLTKLKNPTIRSLLAEWVPGKEYKWKSWLDPIEDNNQSSRSQQSQLDIPTQRPIRPLPSSRPNSPRLPSNGPGPMSYSQPVNVNRNAPPVVQSQPLPNVQVVRGLGLGSRGSSPIPGMEERGEESQWGAATQVERGPFGGRRGGEKKKKVVKKRVGGF